MIERGRERVGGEREGGREMEGERERERRRERGTWAQVLFFIFLVQYAQA